MKLSKKQFYLLSFTWGLPMSLVGLVVCGILKNLGYKPQKYGHCYRIEIGKSWGGLCLGWLFLTGKNPSEHTKNHELGHGYQNACLYGWIMPILSIISAVRYWLCVFGVKIDYYSWRFEAQASEIGDEIMKKFKEREDA